MATTGSRALQLLSLLQRRRWWPGSELADRLDVSVRTLRRDIDRLRSLGYVVAASPGVDGGYRLEGGTADTPLLIGDDEAIAIAVGLRLAAQSSDELAEVALGAVAKVTDSLSPERRRRLDALVNTTTVGTWSRQTTGPSIEVLAAVSGACRDQVRLAFAYRAADGADSARYVEPCGVVILGGRYYLVAFDADRDDWRTFRLDRMHDPRPARNTFAPRAWPDPNLAVFVRRSITERPGRSRVVIDVEGSGDKLRRRFGQWVTITDLDAKHCRVTIDTDSLDGALQFVAGLDHDFRVIEPEAFGDRLATLASRLSAAATTVRATRPSRTAGASV